MISVVIPTYQEVDNIPLIGRAVHDVLRDEDYEILFVDDNSGDGSVEAVASLKQAGVNAHIIVRTAERGLSTAVLHGIAQAQGDIVVTMDADLSHPASAIPALVKALRDDEADFCLGSRYVDGGSLDPSWGMLRRLNSRAATLLALPLAPVRDPMSGFFALRSKDMPPRHTLSPTGYKIALEIMVKGGFQRHRIREVPIHFEDRQHGESKLTFAEQLLYLRHLRRLYTFRYPSRSEFVQFGMVGGSGFVIDLLIYLTLQWLFGLHHQVARAFSFWGSASWNWAWNRLVTFQDRKKTNRFRQWLAFVTTSLLGFAVNWGSYFVLTTHVEFFDRYRILTLAIGVLLGMGFNFMMARIFVFLPLDKEIKAELQGHNH